MIQSEVSDQLNPVSCWEGFEGLEATWARRKMMDVTIDPRMDSHDRKWTCLLNYKKIYQFVNSCNFGSLQLWFKCQKNESDWKDITCEDL